MDKKKALILSIDGGGIRGIIPLTILSLIEQDTGKNILDIFDIYAGTSIGAIVLGGILGINKSPKEILKDFHNQSFIQGIFHRRFSCNLLTFLFGSKYTGASKTHFLSHYLGKIKIIDLKKPTLLTGYNLSDSSPVTFKSTGGKDLNLTDRLSTIIDISSAAPVYFPPVKIQNKYYIDGGVCANNPALAAFSYGISLGYHRNDIRILSIGTGAPAFNFSSNPGNYGKLQWLNGALIPELFNGPATIVDYNLETIINDDNKNDYLRIQEPIPGRVPLDGIDLENLVALDRIGQQWYKQYKDRIFAWLDNALSS